MAVLRLAALKGSDKCAEVYLFSDSFNSFDYILQREDTKHKQYDLAMSPLRSVVYQLSHRLRDLDAKLEVRLHS